MAVHLATSVSSRHMQLDEDDLPIGRILDRREVLRLLALSGAAVLVGCKPRADSAAVAIDSNGVGTTAATANGVLPPCVAKPELTVGPYFVDKQLERSDIRVEPTTGRPKPGAPLHLTFNVQFIRAGQCAPLAGAMVDVWQCDAAGAYSGVQDNTVGFDTSNQKFLRGYQITDGSGVAKFTTIYPGWYQGRAVHIHFKIRTHEDAATRDDASTSYEFTSQLFFDEKLTDVVHAKQPYAARGQRDLRNENDAIYREAGRTLLLNVTPSGDGYDAVFNIGLDLSNKEIGQKDRSGGPGGRRGGPPPGGRRGAPPPGGRRGAPPPDTVR
jgi:protocatechuate 3,4-dioxygenase beta subunit